MVHSFAIGHRLGLPGAANVVDHGMAFLWSTHRDQKNGGYFSAVNDTGPVVSDKPAYGHAFVLLAAASAKMAGHADADRLLADISDVLTTRFWDQNVGATQEEFSADWQPVSDYRGQNSNMHLCEATMAAYEATQDQAYLKMANSIADLIINRNAANLGWRVAEHFDSNWQVDLQYSGDPMFRPRGVTPGHALEWSRLLLQLWELGDRKFGWMKPAAEHLFRVAVATGWDSKAGGFFYTLDWDDMPDQTSKYWWPCAEGIGAAAVLGMVTGDPLYRQWYQKIWTYTDQNFIDHENGGWWPASRADRASGQRQVFTGKPDIYHALQACLIPVLPVKSGIMAGLG